MTQSKTHTPTRICATNLGSTPFCQVPNKVAMLLGGLALKVTCTVRHSSLASGHSRNKCWIDSSWSQKQHRLLPPLIRLQRIYNILLFHAIIVSILDVLYAIICHYISFFGSNLLTQCPVPVAVFCLFLSFQKIIIKKCPNKKKTLKTMAPGSTLSYIKNLKIPCCNLFTFILFSILFYLSTTTRINPCK